MGYIYEPEGIDFFVDPKPLSKKDREEISDIIANFKVETRRASTLPEEKKRIIDTTLRSRPLYHKRKNKKVDS